MHVVRSLIILQSGALAAAAGPPGGSSRKSEPFRGARSSAKAQMSAVAQRSGWPKARCGLQRPPGLTALWPNACLGRQPGELNLGSTCRRCGEGLKKYTPYDPSPLPHATPRLTLANAPSLAATAPPATAYSATAAATATLAVLVTVLVLLLVFVVVLLLFGVVVLLLFGVRLFVLVGTCHRGRGMESEGWRRFARWLARACVAPPGRLRVFLRGALPMR